MHAGVPMRSALAALMASALIASGARAQSDALSRAEAAYLEVDFESTHRHALAALRAGGNRPEQLVRIYQLLGIASSALGHEDEARDYFVRMLGLDRDAELDDSVPPRLRDPYLEARGVWAARPGRLGIRAGLDRASSSLHLELADPTDMARSVIVHARLEGEAQYARHDAEARSAIDMPLPGAASADRVEYYVEVLDEHRNVILAEGSPFEPRVVGRDRATAAGGAAGPSIVEEPVFWIVVGSVVGVAAAITIGVLADQRSHIGTRSTIAIGID